MSDAEEVKKGRALMPMTAALVDELRQALGADRVNAAIQAGQQARKAYAQILADQGEADAWRWLASQRFPAGAFHAVEGGREVGVLPVRPIGDGVVKARPCN